MRGVSSCALFERQQQPRHFARYAARGSKPAPGEADAHRAAVQQPSDFALCQPQRNAPLLELRGCLDIARHVYKINTMSEALKTTVRSLFTNVRTFNVSSETGLPLRQIATCVRDDYGFADSGSWAAQFHDPTLAVSHPTQRSLASGIFKKQQVDTLANFIPRTP